MTIVNDSRLPITFKIIKRLFTRIEINDKHIINNTPCWEWQGYYAAEYSSIYHAHKQYKAHRLMYELFVEIIPEKLVCDHLCRNTKCVNPCHIEIVTNRENVLRGFSPIAMQARQTHCKNGHEFSPANTYLTKKGSRTCKTCQKQKRNEAVTAFFNLPYDHPKRIENRRKNAEWRRRNKQKQINEGRIFQPRHKDKTHCPQGHLYSGDNLVIRKGRRECRICIRVRNLRNHFRRKALSQT